MTYFPRFLLVAGNDENPNRLGEKKSEIRTANEFESASASKNVAEIRQILRDP